MKPNATVALPHPLVDASGPGWAASISTSKRAILSSGREALFVDAVKAGTRVIIVTASRGRISFPLYQLLSLVGGVWLTRDDIGQLRHAVSGAPVLDFEDALHNDPDRVEPELGPPALRTPIIATVPWLQFTVVVHHPARDETRLGGATENLVEAITGKPPTTWGTTEPTLVAWDRARLTALARVRMPRDSRVYVNGAGGGIRYSGSIRASRSEIGVAEETRLIFALPVKREQAVLDRTASLCARLAEYQQVLMATAWSMRGAPDATILPYWPTAPQPVAAVVGARAVRSLGITAEEFASRHDAQVVGNPRTPSLVFDFADEALRWSRFSAAFDDIGSAEIIAILTPPGIRHAS